MARLDKSPSLVLTIDEVQRLAAFAAWADCPRADQTDPAVIAVIYKVKAAAQQAGRFVSVPPVVVTR